MSTESLVPTAERWAASRTFHHSEYPAERIAAARERGGLAREQGRTGCEQGGLGEEQGGPGRAPTVSVCLPARECGGTVGTIVETLLDLRARGVLDEVVVIDADSSDGTAEIAGAAGATVYSESELSPELGGVLGKGDAMWRALGVLEGELVCFLDADTEDFQAHFVTGLLGPLVCEEGVSFVKAFYRRPFEQGGISLPEGGGRVNHLMARPALAVFYPELAGIRQPLAGEVAGRRELLERLPFATGYGVEIAMLIDVWREEGLDGIAQVDLELHRNRHQSLAALSPMAATVLATIATRLEREGRLMGMLDVSPGGRAVAEGALTADLETGARRSSASLAPLERPPRVNSDGGSIARRAARLGGEERDRP